MNFNQKALLLEEAAMLGRIAVAVGFILAIMATATTYTAVMLVNAGIVLLLLKYYFIEIEFNLDDAEAKKANELLKLREFIYGALAISVATEAFTLTLPVITAYTLIFTTFVASWAKLTDT